jgi:uncharacterized protein with PIN domain
MRTQELLATYCGNYILDKRNHKMYIFHNKMNPIDAIEKWISEHGSASILRDHIGLLKSQMAAKDAEIKNLKILLEQKDVQINNLQKIIDSTTTFDEICPYCKQPEGKVIRIVSARGLAGRIGHKTFYYQCDNCGKEYDKYKEP